MIGNIANSLGFGSGLNVNQLVADLAAASRGPKVERFDALARASQAKISAVAQARADLDSFANSLTELVAGGSLRSQPTVSDDKALTATATAGVPLGNLAAEIEILQLARAQTSYSALRASASDPVGLGTMTLAVGSATHSIAIDANNNSLTGLADAINASGSGVRASISTDQGQFRLVLRGETGAAKAFSLSADVGADPLLSQFATGGGMTTGQTAGDALFRIDGIDYSRPTNSVTDALPGVTLSLKKAQAGEILFIGSARPTEAIKQMIGDFVAVFNELRGRMVEARTTTGNGNLRPLERQLAALASKALTGNAGINSLSSIGISTARDGSLSINQSKLDAALASDPDAVEALFNPPRDAAHTESSDPGLAAALDAIRDAAVDSSGAIGGLTKLLQAEAAALARNRERMETREAAFQARLEKQYASLDARIGALRATQGYLEQQIKLWSNER